MDGRASIGLSHPRMSTCLPLVTVTMGQSCSSAEWSLAGKQGQTLSVGTEMHDDRAEILCHPGLNVESSK